MPVITHGRNFQNDGSVLSANELSKLSQGGSTGGGAPVGSKATVRPAGARNTGGDPIYYAAMRQFQHEWRKAGIIPQ